MLKMKNLILLLFVGIISITLLPTKSEAAGSAIWYRCGSCTTEIRATHYIDARAKANKHANSTGHTLYPAGSIGWASFPLES